MRGRRLIPVLVSTALLVLLMNLALARWSHRLRYVSKLDAIGAVKEPNLVLTGNSKVDGQIDEALLEKLTAESGDAMRPVNAALSATNAQEQWLLFDYAVKEHAEIHTLVAGFYNAQLTAEPVTHAMELKGNQLVGLDKRFTTEQVVEAYKFDLADKLEFRFLRACPMVAERANVWKYVELMRRAMGAMRMPSEKASSYGRAADFEAVEAESAKNFEPELREFVKDPTHFNRSYESVFAEAHARGMKVVILLLPISEYHRASYYSSPLWREYMEKMKQLAEARGVELIDGSEWVNGEDNFADPLHLSPAGVEIFTKRLTEELEK